MTSHEIELVEVVKTYTVYRRRSRLQHKRVMVRALDGLSLSVAAGEMVGYIGPNGAGKSTTIKLLAGILVPTSGTVRVAGLDPQRERIRVARRVGVVFGQRTQLWWDLPLSDSFDLLRHVYRVPADRHRQNLATFTDLLELGPFLETPVRQLSLGQRMRGEITAALLHDPAVLYLDEPTIGLDVVSKAKVRAFLKEMNAERGVTVMLTTHDLDDVAELCSRLLVVDAGHVIHDGSVEETRARYAPDRTLVVDLVAEEPPLAIAGAVVIRTDGPRQWLRFSRDETTAAALVAAITATRPIRNISIEEPDIEDVVRRMYADHLAATTSAPPGA